MANKVYGVYSGFYGGMDDSSQLESLWSTEELAKKEMMKEVEKQKLEPYSVVFNKPNASSNCFTDGHHHISIQELCIDTTSIYGDPDEE